jgi:hypothetical protein
MSTSSLRSSSLVQGPPLLRGTVGVRNITYEKHVAAHFTIDGWLTVSEGLARYTGPTISGTHHHGDSDDG